MQITEILKSFSDPNRLRIFNLLLKSELCVGEIETLLNINQSNLSRHLSKLKTTGIVAQRKKAQWTYYYIHPDFLARHTLLINYLQQQTVQEKILKEDSVRFKTYKDNNLTCACIHENKDQVIKTIQG